MNSPSKPLGPPSGVVALSGNPRSGSRTLRVALSVADKVADRLGVGPATPVELADVASELFAAEAPAADAARAALAGAAVAVVATPVYKASYTGLLKAFLDRVPSGGLSGVVAIPVVVSASPAHAFVAEHLLRPLLVELGALVPVRALAVTESELDGLEDLVLAWAEEAVPVLGRVVVTRPSGVPA